MIVRVIQDGVRGSERRMDLFVPLIMLLAFLIIDVFHAENLALFMSSWNRLRFRPCLCLS